MRIFIDESGDLGFRKRASKYFVLAAVIVHDDLGPKRCFKKIRQNKLKKSQRKLPEFKFNNSSTVIKRRILKCLAGCDISIAFAVLRKDQVYERLKDKPQIIYNYLSGALISSIANKYHNYRPVHVCIDKSMYSLTKEHFDDYLAYQMFDSGFVFNLSLDQLIIQHVDSRKEPGIQAADFVAGALHKKYRDGDDTFSGIIDKRIEIALDYFEGRKK